jgi:hypothetical protein
LSFTAYVRQLIEKVNGGADHSTAWESFWALHQISHSIMKHGAGGA